MARKTDVLIIGAGQAGLAISHCLTNLSIPHVVLDRGAVGQRWRAERWASLHLLTPNWMTRLPGWRYDGADPEGFMHKDEVVSLLNRYARGFDAPVHEFTTVEDVRQAASGYRVRTSSGTWFARSVVIASGACDRPAIPGFADGLARSVAQVTTSDYVHPDQLSDGGVLVVGGSATGVQLAEEIHMSGRPVTLAVGAHVRLPRRYRGRDILDWMDHCGILAEKRDLSVPNHKTLFQPSLQLIGSTTRRDIDLNSLDAFGIRCVGRVASADGTRVQLEANLAQDVLMAETRRDRMLSRIDADIAAAGLQVPDAAPTASAVVPPGADLRALDLRAEGIRSVVWATGFRRDYPWLSVPVLDPTGEIRQSGGVTSCPGLFTLGLPFMRRRNSTFIDGVGADAVDISAHITQHLDHTARAAA